MISSDRRAGPVALRPGLVGTLTCLAAAAGADAVVPLAMCAGVLVQRLSRPGTDCRARVVHGPDEALAPAAEDLDLSVSFRTGIERAVRTGSATAPDIGGGQPAAVTIVVAQDGRHLYVETASSSDIPAARVWARSFLRLLSSVGNEPDSPLRAHSVVDADERDRILHRLNPYRVPEIGFRTMAGPFEEQVERSPDAVALLDEFGTTVSYRELNERANRLAHYLRERGAGPGSRIGICLERGIDQLVAIYAATKTGAAYVPVDTDLPDERIAWMLNDSAPRHVLTDGTGRGRVPDGAWDSYEVGAVREPWATCPTTNPVVDSGPDALLHILYTSGTTGRPKGVATLVGAALANVFWMQRQYPFDGDGTALYKASPGFDISIWEIFWPLYHGARLVICRPGAERDPRHLALLTEEHRASQLFLVPTMLTPFLDEITPARADALTWMVCGGEPMSPRLPEKFYATLPASNLVNAFGPTEAGPVTDNVIDRGMDNVYVPVGRPADNFRVTVLDANLDLVPIGVAGEAYISGRVGLGQGYWRAPARTAERFVADPYGPPGSRMYRTGDLCRYREDGALEHLGRIDRQVKVRGMRVEPGEIESVLAAHPAVGDCVVIAHGDPVRLLAFVVPAGQRPATEMDLAAVLHAATELLPVHMVPERLVPVERLPATVNGKIDQAELIRIWQALTERERRLVPPADKWEATLVEIYGRILGTSPISALDSFGQLGGHSLLVFRLLDECKAELQAVPDPTRVLTGTLRDVAASIRERATGRTPEVGFGYFDDQRHRQAR